MPARDGTGPMGQGAMTGRGMGNCATPSSPIGYQPRAWDGRWGCGRGYGRKAGLGRGFYVQPMQPEQQKDWLEAQKKELENRLKEIDEQINNQ